MENQEKIEEGEYEVKVGSKEVAMWSKTIDVINQTLKTSRKNLEDYAQEIIIQETFLKLAKEKLQEAEERQ